MTAAAVASPVQFHEIRNGLIAAGTAIGAWAELTHVLDEHAELRAPIPDVVEAEHLLACGGSSEASVPRTCRRTVLGTEDADEPQPGRFMLIQSTECVLNAGHATHCRARQVYAPAPPHSAATASSASPLSAAAAAYQSHGNDAFKRKGG
eukprot:1157450-Pelagomonas_calceolata.AAC.2